MRINKYLALHASLSRRAAEQAIVDGRVLVNGSPPEQGQAISDKDVVLLDHNPVTTETKTRTIMLNKPIGYVVSRDGQGSKTIYDLLPHELHNLKPVGRLDKNSSGLLLLTNDGGLAHRLTHPSFEKTKIYEVALNKELAPADYDNIQHGVRLEDGMSRLKLKGNGRNWTVTMHEGRNRQIRRTFEILGYRVTKLHRTHFGQHALEGLSVANYREI